MRCFVVLVRWEEFNNFCKEYWILVELVVRLEMVLMVRVLCFFYFLVIELVICFVCVFIYVFFVVWVV